MKKLLFIFGIILITGGSLLAQAPQSFKYQAIARDIEGNVISDQQISLKINLILGSKTGQAVYSEIHDLKTNKFGLINLEIGKGKNKTGEISSINWGLSKYFVNVEIDIKGGSNYESMGISQLLSVPYALYAETSGGTTKAADSWTDAGSVTYLTGAGYKVGIGTTTPGSFLHVLGDGANTIFERNTNGISSPSMICYKSRGTAAAKTVVQIGDILGQFQFRGYTSGGYKTAAKIESRVEQIGTSAVSGNLLFYTIHPSSYINTERMRLAANGNVGIGTTAPEAFLHVLGDGANTIFERNTNGISSPSMICHKSRGTAAVKTVVQVGDILGQFQFRGYTSGGYKTAAKIESRVEKVGTSAVSGNLLFYTIDTSSYTNAERMRLTAEGWLGIGTTAPSTNLHIWESNTDTDPAVLIQQAGTGDASLRFKLGTGSEHFTQGIDNNDNDNYKISNDVELKGTTYGESSTMMQIHTENTKDGIIDFNHQSRARVHLENSTASINCLVWTPILFDAASYDEHGEWLLPAVGGTSQFFATEEGYYQVNSRTEFVCIDYAGGSAYCSIAIFKNGSMYAQGNNLDLQAFYGEQDANNNAPNVSDVVYLQPGDYVEIHVYHSNNGAPPLMDLRVGKSQTYCSIHKVS